MPRTAMSTAPFVALAVLAAAGCASFDPNPAAQQQGAPPVAVAASPAATAASGDPETPAVMPDFLVGLASVADEPIVNAPFQVLDALTGQPVGGARQVTVAGILPAGELTTDENGLILFTLPQGYPGKLVRVVVQTPEGAFLNSLLAVEPTATGYRLFAGTGACSANPAPVTVKGPLKLNVAGQTTSGQAAAFRAQFVDVLSRALNTRIALDHAINADAYELLATGCTANGAFKLDLTSTFASSAMSGVLALLKADLAGGRSVTELLAAAQTSAQTIDKEFGKNSASQKAAYDAYAKDPSAKKDLGLGVAYKQIEDALTAAGVPKADLQKTVAESFTAVLKQVQAAGTADLTKIVLTPSDVPSVLNLAQDLRSGTFTYIDPTTNETVKVTVGDPPPDTTTQLPPEPVIELPDEGEPDFLTDAAKLAPKVTVSYTKDDQTSPLRLTVEQAGGTFDVKTITATIPSYYVADVDLDAAANINDAEATTISDVAGASSGWGTLTGGQPHRVTATTASDTDFTGVWSFGSDLPGTKIADVVIKETAASVKVDLTFALLGNNAVETKGGKVVMDILKSVIALDATRIAQLTRSNANIVDILITSRAGTDVAPATNATAAAVNYTRPVVLE